MPVHVTSPTGTKVRRFCYALTIRSSASGVTGCSVFTAGGSPVMMAEMTLASVSPGNAREAARDMGARVRRELEAKR
jgi:hypothetical protein